MSTTKPRSQQNVPRPSMKIAELESIPLAIPFTHGAERGGFKGQDWSRIYMLLIRVQTEEGVVGWGDAFAYGSWRPVKAAFDSMVAPLVVGERVDDIGAFLGKAAQQLHIFGRNGIVQYALSGLDIALWDAYAKLAGLPLHRLIGKGGRQSVPGYSSLFKYGDPDVVAAMCRESLDDGFRWVKLHETSVEAIRSAREAVGGDIPLMIDVNCPWTLDEAFEAATRFREFNPYWLEEPVYPPEDFASLSLLNRNSGIPIALGENACGLSDFQKLISAGSASFAQPSVTKVGGITTFLEVASLCAKSGVPLYPHSPYFGPGFVATLHLAASMEASTVVEWFKLRLEADLFGKATMPRGGAFTIPDAPGLGLEPDPAVLAHYRVAV